MLRRSQYPIGHSLALIPSPGRPNPKAELASLASDLGGPGDASQIHAERRRDELDANHGSVGVVVDDPRVVQLLVARRGRCRDGEVGGVDTSSYSMFIRSPA